MGKQFRERGRKFTLYAPGERGKNAYIIARGTVCGEQREISTRTTDQADAKRAWNRFVDAEESRLGTGEKTFEEVAGSYKEARNSSKTDERYIDRMIVILGPLDIGSVKPADIYATAQKLYPSGSAATKNRQVIAPASAIINFGAESEWCPPIRLKRFKEGEPETRRPKQNVRDTLLMATEGPQHLLLALLFRQGFRITETLRISGEHIDIKAGTIRLYVGKVRRWKAVPMHPDVWGLLSGPFRGLTEAEGRVFSWGDRHNVYRWLRPLCKRLGVEFTPHMARHEFGGSLREGGATGRDLTDVGTWTSARSTERYQGAGDAHHRDVIERLK